MKITQMDLRGFRSYKALTLDLNAGRVLVAGLNGTGKTSLREAIRWAMLGFCEGTDARGAGADVLIASGLETAQVMIDIAGIGTIQRAFSARSGDSLSVEKVTGTAQVHQAAIFAKLNTSPAFLSAVLSPDVFLSLGHAEAKALVLSLLDVKIPIPAEPINVQVVDTNTKSTVGAPFKSELSARLVTLDELDALYRQAFDDRQAAKKALAGFTMPPSPNPEGLLLSPAATVPVTVEAVEGQLSKLRSQRVTLGEAVGETIGRRKALTQQRQQFASQILMEIPADLSVEMSALEREIESAESSIVPSAQVDAPTAGDPQRLNFLRSTSATMTGFDPTKGCIIDREVTCRTSAAIFRDRLAAVNKELRALDPKPAAPAPVTESPLTALRKRLQGMQQRQGQREHAIQITKQASSRIEEIDQELLAIPDTSEQESQIAALDSRIANGEKLLATARAYYTARQAHDTADFNRKALADEVDRLEALVEQLGPKGVRVQALADAMSTFEGAINPYLTPFGWTISFAVEPWTVLANQRPVETYSRSERFRIGIALQLAIAQLSGLSFAVIDELDMLDVPTRKIVSGMLKDSPVEQILILGTREAEQALPKLPAGSLAYRLAKQNDSTVIAERSAA